MKVWQLAAAGIAGLMLLGGGGLKHVADGSTSDGGGGWSLGTPERLALDAGGGYAIAKGGQACLAKGLAGCFKGPTTTTTQPKAKGSAPTTTAPASPFVDPKTVPAPDGSGWYTLPDGCRSGGKCNIPGETNAQHAKSAAKGDKWSLDPRKLLPPSGGGTPMPFPAVGGVPIPIP